MGTYLIMGGVDITGPSLYEIAAHGSTSKVPFCTMGSGTLAAMSVLESHWKPDMEEEDAKQLVRQAIRAGIFKTWAAVAMWILSSSRQTTMSSISGALTKPTRRERGERSTATRPAPRPFSLRR